MESVRPTSHPTPDSSIDFSDLEVEHILANFEATGIGNLRLDRGDTVMNDQEVAYLKMVSGSIGQKLLDSTVI